MDTPRAISVTIFNTSRLSFLQDRKFQGSTLDCNFKQTCLAILGGFLITPLSVHGGLLLFLF